MLGKLIKHDFRAFARTLLPMQLGVLGGGILAVVLTRLSTALLSATRSGAVGPWVQIFSVLFFLLVGLLVLVVCASSLVTLVLICLRVQKNFFGDEGYLTFSLPTTAGRLLWSKIITGTLWMLINGAVILFTMFLFGLFGTADGALINLNVWQSVGGLFRGFGDLFTAIFSAEAVPGMWLLSILAMLDCLAWLLLQVIMLCFSIIAGGMSAQKHKLLAAIGVYLAAHFVLGILFTVGVAVCVTAVGTMAPVGAVWFMLLSALVVLGGLSAGLFFWSRHLIKDRLNLQ